MPANYFLVDEQKFAGMARSYGNRAGRKWVKTLPWLVYPLRFWQEFQ